MALAWENLWRFLWCWSSFCCCCSSFAAFDFVVVSSFDFQATWPCHWHSTLASQTREGLHQLWALPQLLLIAFSFSSTGSAMVLSGYFLLMGVFYLTLLPNILAQPAFIKVSLGAGSYFFKSCRASYWYSKQRPGPSVWFTVIHNLLYILALYLCISILQKFYLWRKLW